MNTPKSVQLRLQELAKKNGFLPDSSLLEFAELIVGQCIEVCDEVFEDIENGDIFRTEKELLKDIEAGHVGLAAHYAGRKIRERFGLEAQKHGPVLRPKRPPG